METPNLDLVFGALAFLSLFAVGAAYVLARALRRKPVEARLRRLEGESNPVAMIDDAMETELGTAARFAKVFSHGKPSESIKARLARAGFHNRSAAAVYLGAKLLLLVAGGFGTALLTLLLPIGLPGQILLAASVGALCSFLPNLVVHVHQERRRKEMQSHLPNALDLLEICVSAGMGLDMAWNCVADEVRHVSTTLADEMALTNLEMHLGASRTTAMRHMVDRTGVADLGSLVAVLVQSERFGTSISDALRTFASSMRELRSQRAQETAEKMAVKLLFPMVLFIFPVMLIVVGGPAIMKLTEIMSAG